MCRVVLRADFERAAAVHSFVNFSFEPAAAKEGDTFFIP